MRDVKVRAYLNPFSDASVLKLVAPGSSVLSAFKLFDILPTFKTAIWINDKEARRDSILRAGDNCVIRVIPKAATLWPSGSSAPARLSQGSPSVFYGPRLGTGGGYVAQQQQINNSGFASGLLPWIGGALGIGAAVAGMFLGSSGNNSDSINNQVAPETDPAVDNSLPPVENFGGAKDALMPQLTGVSNQENKWGEFTCIFGENVRVYPLLGMHSYTMIQGADQYVYGCLDLGYGELVLSDFKIGSRLVSDMPDVTMEARAGTAADASFTIPLGDVNDTVLSVDLPYNVAKQSRAGKAVTKLSVDITFPDGLWSSNTYDGETPQSVQFVINYKEQAAGAWSTENFTATAQTKTAIRFYHEWTVPGSGTYDVKITRGTYEQPVDEPWPAPFNGGATKAVWTNVKAWGTGEPFKTIKDTAGNTVYCSRIAIMAKATPEQQGALEDFSCLASRKLRHWNGTTFDAPAVTSNPADIVLEILTGQANFKPVATSNIDLASFLDWYNFCVSKGLTYRKAVDQGVKAIDLIKEVCAAGRAQFVYSDGKYTVLVDKPRATVAQHFSLRNIIRDSFVSQQNLGNSPNVIYAQFINPDADYQMDEIEVYDDGYNADNADNPQTIFFSGCYSATEAHKRAKYQMAVTRLQFWNYTFRTAVSHLACRFGDRVRVTHDAIFAGLGQGRITSLTLNGSGDITAITIDAMQAMETGNSYGLQVMRSSGAELHLAVNTVAGDTKTFTLTTPILAAETDKPIAGNPVQFGVYDYESIECLVTNITPAEDFTAQISCVDYIPAIYDADTGTIPAYVTRISLPHETTITTPVPTVIAYTSGTAALIRAGDGGVNSTIAITMQAETYPVTDFEYQVRLTGTTYPRQSQKTPAANGLISVQGVEDGKIYDVRIRNRRYDNYVSDWNEVITAHTVIGKTEPPTNVPATVHRIPGTDMIGWFYDAAHGVTVPLDHAGFVVKMAWGENRNWDQGVVLNPLCLANQFNIGGLARGMKTIMIKAVDMTGNEQSGDPAYIMLDFGDVVTANIVRSDTIDLSTVTVTGGALDAGTLKANDDGSLWWGDDLSTPWFDEPLTADWFDQTYSEMVVSFTRTFDASELKPFTHRLSSVISGPHKIEYKLWGQSPWFEDPLAGDWFSDPLTDPWWGEDDPQWLPLPDQGLQGEWQQFDFRITCFAGSAQGIISSLISVVDVPDITETILGVLVTPGGYTVTPTSAFRSLERVRVDVENTDTYPDGRTAIVSNKASGTPSVKVYDGSNVATSSIVDITLQGY